MSDQPTPPGAATFSAEFFEPLFAAEDRHFWFRSRNRCIGALARSMPDFNQIKDVMEHGCGNGFVLAELQRIFPQARVRGADLFAEGLAFARRRFTGELLQVDVLNSGFKEAFDLIGFFDVLEHLDDDLAVLRALRSQLRPGGALLLTVPAHMALWSDYDESSCHRRRYSRKQLEDVMRRADFKVEYCTEFMTAVFPLMWARRRLFHRKKPDNATPADIAARELAELLIHPVPNTILNFILRPEAWWIKHRWRLAPGTSLLALARRVG